MAFTPAIRLAAALALGIFSCAAWAQYVWTDERGVKQYSDQPPPASVPKNRILKHPSAWQPSGSGNTEAAAADAGKTGEEAAKPAPTLADRNADFAKRRAEREEKEKKAAEEARIASEKAKNCESARNYRNSLASGQRVALTDKDGQRNYLNDEQRKRELAEADRVLADCK